METIAQHQYARLADAAYHFDDKKGRRHILDGMNETASFVMDATLSDSNASVFVNQTTGAVVVSYRGTTNASDIKTDAAIFVGKERSTARYKSSMALMERVKAKYDDGGHNIDVTGHSLGGGIAMYVAESNGLESFVFNAAIGHKDIFGKRTKDYMQNPSENTHIYSTELDPVSFLQVHLIDHANGTTSKDSIDPTHARETTWVKNHKGYSPHTLEGNFYSDDATRTTDGLFFNPTDKESTAETVLRLTGAAIGAYYGKLYGMIHPYGDMWGTHTLVRSVADTARIAYDHARDNPGEVSGFHRAIMDGLELDNPILGMMADMGLDPGALIDDAQYTEIDSYTPGADQRASAWAAGAFVGIFSESAREHMEENSHRVGWTSRLEEAGADAVRPGTVDPLNPFDNKWFDHKGTGVEHVNKDLQSSTNLWVEGMIPT